MIFQGETKVPIIPMLDFVQIAIDQHSVDDFRAVIIEYANLLKTEISEDVLINLLAFEQSITNSLRVYDYKNIRIYQYTDTMFEVFNMLTTNHCDGKSIEKLNDLTNLGLFYYL
jgi:hypothetical protein